jgi:hypothetical protein
MLEGDLPLRNVVVTRFVNHHDKYCSEHRDAPQKCADLSLAASEASARFVSQVAGSIDDARGLRVDLGGVRRAWKFLRGGLKEVVYRPGGVNADESQARKLAKCVLGQYGVRKDADAFLLVSIFATELDARRAIIGRLDDVFGSALEAEFGQP